jgi:hypothetical protein
MTSAIFYRVMTKAKLAADYQVMTKAKLVASPEP